MEIKVGDKVINKGGKTFTVTNVFERTESNAYITVTEENRFVIALESETGRRSTTYAQKLKVITAR